MNAVQTPWNSLLPFLIGHSNSGPFVSIATFQERIFHQRTFLKRACHTDSKKLKTKEMAFAAHPTVPFGLLDYCFCTTILPSKIQQRNHKRNVYHSGQFIFDASQRKTRRTDEKGCAGIIKKCSLKPDIFTGHKFRNFLEYRYKVHPKRIAKPKI